MILLTCHHPGIHIEPSLFVFMGWGSLSFFCLGFVFGNANAMAMAPFGHMAGVAAAVIGSTSMLISMIMGTIIGQSYNGTALPMIGGFALLGTLALTVLFWDNGTQASPNRTD